MKILFLAHRIPYPPNKGDKIRSFNELKFLADRHEVDLACLADDPADMRYAEDLRKYCRKVAVFRLSGVPARMRGGLRLLAGQSLSAGYFYKAGLQHTVDQWLAETAYDAIFCFSSPMAEYVLKSGITKIGSNGGPGKRPRLVIDFCDVDSHKWLQYANLSSFPKDLFYRTEFRRLLAYETFVNETFDHTVLVSQKEGELFFDLAPGAKNVAIIPNGVDHGYFSPGAAKAGIARHHRADTASHRMVFTGAMDYHANVDGVCWFCREIFPKILDVLPEAVFYIVGSKPAPDVQRLAEHPNVIVTGFVDDIRPYYEQADIAVIPLRLARGVQNKVLEAMSMEKAVVATPSSLQGIQVAPGVDVEKQEDARGFALAAIDLLQAPDRAEALGRSARRRILQDYGWNRAMAGLEALLQG